MQAEKAAAGGAPKLGRYELVHELAGSGVASNWIARAADEGEGGLFTLLRVHKHLIKKTEVVDAFLADVERAKPISGPHLVPLLDVAASETELYVASDFVEGETLTSLVVAAGPEGLPLGVALRVVLDVLRALDEAAMVDPEIAHGEIGPHQIRVGTDGVSRLAGFGVARALAKMGPHGVKSHDRLAYAAPERVKAMASPSATSHAEPSAKADLFSIGVILWELAARQRLFASKIEAAVIQKVLTAPVPPLASFEVPNTVDDVVVRLLDRDPARRIASAHAALDALADARPLAGTAKDVAAFVEKIAGKAITARRTELEAALGGAYVPPPKPQAPRSIPPPPKPAVTIEAKVDPPGDPAKIDPPIEAPPIEAPPKIEPPKKETPVREPPPEVPPPQPIEAPPPIEQPPKEMKKEVSEIQPLASKLEPLSKIEARGRDFEVVTRTMATITKPSVKRDDSLSDLEAISFDAFAVDAALDNLEAKGDVPAPPPPPAPPVKRPPRTGTLIGIPPVGDLNAILARREEKVESPKPAAAKPIEAKHVDEPPKARVIAGIKVTAAKLPGVVAEPSDDVPPPPVFLTAATASESASAPATGPAAELGPGSVLGRYEILAPIAHGGMATVWAARQKGTRGFQKIVAVKTMHPALSSDAEHEKMFLDEASIAARIKHPNVVEVHDLGEENGQLYLVMEWIEGDTLSAIYKAAKPGGGIPLPIILRIATQTLAGLHAAHELRDENGERYDIVHRDISPSNILVTMSGFAKVADFGIMKAKHRAYQTMALDVVKGKTPFMSPEQAVPSSPIDRRSDIFSLGITLYVLATGIHPFRGENDLKTVENINNKTPMPLRNIDPGIVPEFEAIVLKALSKDPKQRFKTAHEMRLALEQVAASIGSPNDEDVAAFVKRVAGDAMSKRAIEIRSAIAAIEGGKPLPEMPPRAPMQSRSSGIELGDEEISFEEETRQADASHPRPGTEGARPPPPPPPAQPTPTPYTAAPVEAGSATEVGFASPDETGRGQPIQRRRSIATIAVLATIAVCVVIGVAAMALSGKKEPSPSASTTPTNAPTATTPVTTPASTTTPPVETAQAAATTPPADTTPPTADTTPPVAETPVAPTNNRAPRGTTFTSPHNNGARPPVRKPTNKPPKKFNPTQI